MSATKVDFENLKITTMPKSSTKAAGKIYSDIAIKKLPKSQVEITGKIAADVLESFRAKALKNINDEVTIDGFRKGNVPEKVLIAKVGDMTILEEMAELALSTAYPSIVVEEKIDAIGRPEIGITKLAKENPLEFKIVTTVIPDITLADYKKVAADENKKAEEKAKKDGADEVTDAEVEDAIKRIRTSHAMHNHKHAEGDDHSSLSKEEHDKLVESEMPPLDDEFVKTVGDFKDLADFKNKIKEALTEDKKTQNKEKRRIAIADRITAETTIDLPALLVNSELQRIEAQFRDDISRMGVTFDDYMKHAKKTIDDIRKEWTPHAEKKAKLQLIINKIADVEKIKAETQEIEEEVAHIMDHYKDADRERAYIYAESIITNEKVLKFLEEQK